MELEKEGVKKHNFTENLSQNKDQLLKAKKIRLKYQDSSLISKRKVENLLHCLMDVKM